ncbi:MAG: DUF4838 domain-containing protein [Planctomycetaceae bacterium]
MFHRWMISLACTVTLALPTFGYGADLPKDLTPVKLLDVEKHAPVKLVEAGKPVGTICVMGPRSRMLNEAIAHLQVMIKQSTGAELPIVDNQLVTPGIIIGNCDAAKQAGLVGTDMPAEGFAIKTTAEYVFIVGNDGTLPDTGISDGTAWGVIDFLERLVGVRWYYPTELGQSVLPQENLAIEPISYADAPAFRKREIWPPYGNPWNGSGTQLMPVQNFLRSADSWPYKLRVHSPDWSKVTEYVEQRPEVFQLRSDGTRDNLMLCYGDPRTLTTYMENIDRHAKGETPVHLGITGKTVTVSPADAEIACYCDHCRKLWNEDGGQYGSASKIVATFVAELGKALAEKHPDYTVLYLPYLNYTSAVDDLKLPGNVEIQLCGMPGLAQYKEPTIAAEEQETIDRWIASSGRKIQNWHYSCWPEDRTPAAYLFPHTIADFYRRNRDKTVGTFINGTYDHWPRQHLSLYCWMKVLWNPDIDVDAVIDEYCRRMYGPAAETMRELTRLQTDGWEQSQWPSERLSPKATFEASFPPATIDRMEQLLAKAREQLAGDELAIKRLDYYSTPFAEFFKQARNYHDKTGMKPLLAQKIGENPQIDGNLDDAVWERATENTFVRGWDKKQLEPTYPTTVKAVWTPEGITFGFQMHEPTPDLLERTIKGQDDSMAWWDDNIEMLFDPTGENSGDFYHFIINVNNAVADAHAKDFSQNYPAVKSAVAVGKDSWSLEVYVPYDALSETLKPGSGTNTVWYGNFTRHRVADQGLKPKVGRAQNSLREYQRMNTTYALPSNNLSDFAPIEFRE